MATARSPRARRSPRVPPQAVRTTRGPRPPDQIVIGLQELIRQEFATVVLATVLAEFERAGVLRTDAMPRLRGLGSLVTERIKSGIRGAAQAIRDAARAGVARAVRPERSTRIPSHLEEEGRMNAGFSERVVRSVNASGLDAVLQQAIERAERAGTVPDRGEITRAVTAAGERAARAVKSDAQELSAEYTRRYSEASGLTKYVWTTQLDERVRDGHALLEGTIQLWSEPPVTHDDGHRAHPGVDRNCRCVAFPWDDGGGAK